MSEISENRVDIQQASELLRVKPSVVYDFVGSGDLIQVSSDQAGAPTLDRGSVEKLAAEMDSLSNSSVTLTPEVQALRINLKYATILS